MGETLLLGAIAGFLFYAAMALPEPLWILKMISGHASLILFGMAFLSIFFPEIAELTLDIMKGMVLLIWNIGEEL